MSRCAELHAELVEDGYLAEPEQPEPNEEDMRPMDVTGSQIDQHLADLDKAFEADIRWEEMLLHFLNEDHYRKHPDLYLKPQEA